MFECFELSATTLQQTAVFPSAVDEREVDREPEHCNGEGNRVN
jgi:hypothetical protein